MKHFLTVPVFLLLSACANGGSDSGDGAPGENTPTAACAAISSSNWSAWIDAEPPGPSTLHIRGDVELPTPGYRASWRVGAADRRLPPGQTMHLTFEPPEGIVAQVVTTQSVAYANDAAYPEYRLIRVMCGDTELAEITDIPIAQ